MSRVKVKICGITSIEDALLACEYGADAIGFVFYTQSPRYITPQDTIEIIEKLPAFISTVGVFVNEPIENINNIVNLTGINYIQLHGDEPMSTISRFGRRAIKAFRIKDALSIKEVNESGLNFVLLDSYTKNYGGSGKSFDHELLKGLSKNIKFILSGGITPENVSRIIQLYKPYAVDVSSGVESSPGKKSIEKIKLLFERINSCR
ncbi:MAG: phosphoribosylanthranilate isomerase [bacterium]